MVIDLLLNFANLSMPNKLVLHIGTTKTGTTSIQHFLYENRNYLSDKFSLMYPVSKGIVKKNKKKSEGVKFIGGGNFRKKIISLLKQSNFTEAENLLDLKFRECFSMGARITLFSAEALLGLADFPGGCKLISGVSKKYFDEVQVICCIRPPLDHALSQYGEYVKRRGVTVPFNKCLERIFIDVGSRLKCYRDHFGPDSLQILPYEDPSKLSVVTRFLGIVDSSILNDSLVEERINAMERLNRSFSPLECEAARHLNKLFSELKADRAILVRAFNSYMSRHDKDSLRKFHYASSSDLDRFECICRESLGFINQIGEFTIPFSTSFCRDGILSAPRDFNDEEKAKIMQIAWHMIEEVASARR